VHIVGLSVTVCSSLSVQNNCTVKAIVWGIVIQKVPIIWNVALPGLWNTVVAGPAKLRLAHTVVVVVAAIACGKRGGI
jgi:hypothetical protein